MHRAELLVGLFFGKTWCCKSGCEADEYDSEYRRTHGLFLCQSKTRDYAGTIQDRARN
jgi:hypothetical protein